VEKSGESVNLGDAFQLINHFIFRRSTLGLVIRGLVEVRPCPHGRGLFASRDIRKDGVVRHFEDVVLTSRPTEAPRGKYALRIGESEYWDGFPKGSPDYWSNFIDHSDNPNTVFIFDKEKRKARLKATKAIRKGQELFIKYDYYFETNPSERDFRPRVSGTSTSRPRG
jgi:SET domain-containing protein